MNNTLTGKEWLNSLGRGTRELVARLMEQMFGSRVHEPIFGTFTWTDLGVVVCLLLIVLILHGVVASWVRRRIRHAEAQETKNQWRTGIFHAIGKPIYVAIWIYGAYFAIAALAAPPSPDAQPSPQLLFAERSFDVAVFVVLFWTFYRLTHVLELRLAAWSATTDNKLDDLVAPLLGRSLRVIVPVVGIIFALPIIKLPPEYAGIVAKASSILLICTVAWIAAQAVTFGEKAVLAKYDIKAADNLQARKVFTQVHIISKTLYVLIAIFTVASVLMLFEEVRRFGTSILASAGVVGIIIGFAAQRTIANLFAGFQLAMTQPIRIDDVVIVENEWGRVEEITLTYIVVRIWDERRLVVPLSYFIEKPFQNWTRVSSSLLGSVFLWVDYTTPLADVRKATEKIVTTCADWDRRFWNLQVTDMSERSMQIRVLATAADSGKAWNLRCEIRERLVEFIQQQHPQQLPKARVALENTQSLASAFRAST